MKNWFHETKYFDVNISNYNDFLEIHFFRFKQAEFYDLFEDFYNAHALVFIINLEKREKKLLT